MKPWLRLIFSTFLLALAIVSCAKRGSPTGGEVDEAPPKFVKANPEPFTTNFDAEEIRIYFDEYVKLNNSQEQIIISPPITPRPSITPLGNASKYVKIELNDTVLRDNTTYAINFGRSIQDNNEGNPLEFYSYVFSTGDYIDSLQVKGTVKDAYLKDTESFITVALYELDETFSDSTVFKEIPRYLTNTLDSGNTFQLNNLKAGKYRLVGFKDNNSNYTYEPRSDKIGFLQDTINLPTDSSFNLTLFKEVPSLRFEKPKQLSKQHILFAYIGDGNDATLELLTETPDNFEYRLLKDQNTDSLNYWFKPYIEATDSLIFKVTKEGFQDTLITRLKDQSPDSLVVTPNFSGTLPLETPFSITANIPLQRIDSTKFSVVDKDTLDVPFNVSIDSIRNDVIIDFETSELNAYNINILPNGVTDFFENTNDTLRFSTRTKERSDYGDLFVTIDNVESYPIIVMLLDDKGTLIEDRYKTEAGEIGFRLLDPKMYSIRVVHDRNENGVWDTGSYLENRQPEKVAFYNGQIEVRANSEIYQTISVN